MLPYMILANAIYSIVLLFRLAFPLRTSVNFFSSLFPRIEPHIWADNNSIFQGLDNLLTGNSYYGQWATPEGHTILDFSNQKGYARLSFSAEHSTSDNTTLHEQLFLHFYDGVYVDENSIRFSLPKDKFTPVINITNMTVVYSNFSVTVFPKYSGTRKCIADMTIYFLDTRNGLPVNLSSLPDSDHVGIQASFNSSSCGISLSTSVATTRDPDFIAQLGPYSAIMYFSVIATAFAYFALYAKTKKKPLFVLDLSLGTLHSLSTFDIFLFFDHVYTSTVLGSNTTRPILQGVGIVYAAVFAFFNLPLVMETKYQITKLPWKDIIKKINHITNICLVFNIVTFIFAFETVVLQQRLLFYVMFSLFFLPQIIQNFAINKRQRGNYWYFGVLFLPKIAYFIYTEGYYNNIFRLAPNMPFCVIILTIIGVQMILLMIQSRWPRFWLKKKHEYTIKKQSTAQNCPICLQDFDEFDHEAKSSLQTPLMKPQSTSESIVNTPCHHEFHLKCLKSWLTHKFECPYCRQSLPFSHQLDDCNTDSLETTF